MHAGRRSRHRRISSLDEKLERKSMVEPGVMSPASSGELTVSRAKVCTSSPGPKQATSAQTLTTPCLLTLSQVARCSPPEQVIQLQHRHASLYNVLDSPSDTPHLSRQCYCLAADPPVFAGAWSEPWYPVHDQMFRLDCSRKTGVAQLTMPQKAQST